MIGNDAEARQRRLAKVVAISKELEEKQIPTEPIEDLVHDAASEAATSVNNAGLPAQIEYLLRKGWTPADIIGRLKILKAQEEAEKG